MNHLQYDAIGKKIMIGTRVIRECASESEASKIADEMNAESIAKYRKYHRERMARRQARKKSEAMA